jgi:hypothetical protein
MWGPGRPLCLCRCCTAAAAAHEPMSKHNTLSVPSLQRVPAVYELRLTALSAKRDSPRRAQQCARRVVHPPAAGAVVVALATNFLKCHPLPVLGDCSKGVTMAMRPTNGHILQLGATVFQDDVLAAARWPAVPSRVPAPCLATTTGWQQGPNTGGGCGRSGGLAGTLLSEECPPSWQWNSGAVEQWNSGTVEQCSLPIQSSASAPPRTAKPTREQPGRRAWIWLLGRWAGRTHREELASASWAVA